MPTKEELAARVEQLTAQLAAQQEQAAQAKLDAAFAGAPADVREVLSPVKLRAIYGEHFDVQQDGSIIGHTAPRGAADRARILDHDGSFASPATALAVLIAGDPDMAEMKRNRTADRAPASTGSTGSGIARIAANLPSYAQPQHRPAANAIPAPGDVLRSDTAVLRIAAALRNTGRN